MWYLLHRYTVQNSKNAHFVHSLHSIYSVRSLLVVYNECEYINNDVRSIGWKDCQNGQSISIGMDSWLKWLDGDLPSPMHEDSNQQVERCMVCLPLGCTSVPRFAGFCCIWLKGRTDEKLRLRDWASNRALSDNDWSYSKQTRNRPQQPSKLSNMVRSCSHFKVLLYPCVCTDRT